MPGWLCSNAICSVRERSKPRGPGTMAPSISPAAGTDGVAARISDVVMEFQTTSGPVRGLDDVSLELREGEFLVLVGRSGSGKTTALNVLAGLHTATMGEVSVLAQPPVAARPQLGYMFARDALLPWRTALKNVEFGLEVRGFAKSERRALARDYLDLVGLKRFADNYPSQLSQGQRQRVALARTWAPSPKILLMDEPFSALDAQTRESLHEELVRMWAADKKSVVFVTHDLNEAITLSDWILVFKDGKIAKEFSIPFARPRDLVDITADRTARDIYHEIRQLLYQH
ncbi:ABC transporter ATP-binding protein [Mesorhizobium sp. M00.F.Ca.ET.149.01.1.1]|nr:ABC transporter ATP-binding protein [Mesorhizobium sp. M00.F.Ca.ET.149.01.1.1]